MRTATLSTSAALLLAACGQGASVEQNSLAAETEVRSTGGTEDAAAASRWDLQSSGEGIALALLTAGDATAVRLFCPSGSVRLIVNVPAFWPIGSEERMSFGSDGEAHALVADPSGDAQRGGVTGTGAVPANLAALIGGPVAVSYGAQNSGPHTAPPEELAVQFVRACGGRKGEPAVAKPAEVGACRMENGMVLPPNRLKAVGTEPFWAARIEGRCVTYSTPENQLGTRIWATFDGSRDSGVWTGFYENQRFVLRTRPSPGCSDGMSDKRYPVGVTLVVGGEERIGCAEYP